MFIDFHTHKIYQKEGVKCIYNVIWGENELNLTDTVSVGIHPWYIDAKNWRKELYNLEKLAAHDQVKLIGETGLDKVKGADWETQKQVFSAHIEIAKKLKKPLVLHCVRAYNETLEMLKEAQINVPVIFHGFSKKPELALQLVHMGYYLSFGKSMLIMAQVQDALRQIDEKYFFLETDDGEGVEIEEVYEKAAELRGISLDILKNIIKNNYKRLINE